MRASALAFVAFLCAAPLACTGGGEVTSRPLWEQVEQDRIVEESGIVADGTQPVVGRQICDPGSGDFDRVVYRVAAPTVQDLDRARELLFARAVSQGWALDSTENPPLVAQKDVDGSPAWMSVALEQGELAVRFEHRPPDC